MSKKSVLRYAPSPTGPQHIGGLRTALYCHLLARQLDAELILRIEDTDQERFVEGAEEFIVRACEWLGIRFTQGVHLGGPHAPYRQSERSDIYRKHVDMLLAAGHAYYAFDTEAELDEMRVRLESMQSDVRTYSYVTRMTMKNSFSLPVEEVDRRLRAGDPYVVRFKVPEKAEVRFYDEIRGWVHVHGSHLDDKVLLKSDGLPTYHLANVVDDHLMGVTHVVRGDEWLPSAPLHVLLYRAFGWEDTMPKFAHLSLLHDPRGRKLSKRNADEFKIPVFAFNWLDKESNAIWQGFADLGYLPEALVNFLALLGWHPESDQEFFTMDELIQKFSLERCQHAPARFDLDKMNAFQEHYIRQKSIQELAELAKPHIKEAGLAYPGDPFLFAVVELMRERIRFAHQIAQDAKFFFVAPKAYDATMTQKQWKPDTAALLADFTATLKSIDSWIATAVHDAFHAFIGERQIGVGKLMAPLRLVLTGVPNGPGCFEIAAVIGREETIRRIEEGIKVLGS